MEGSNPIDLNRLAIKARSKKELYDVLLSDCGIYMPPIQFANANYVRDVLTGLIKVRWKKAKLKMIYSI